MKFKVGDRVQVVTKEWDSEYKKQYGLIGTISDFYGDWIEVRFDRRDGNCYHEYQLEFENVVNTKLYKMLG